MIIIKNKKYVLIEKKLFEEMKRLINEIYKDTKKYKENIENGKN